MKISPRSHAQREGVNTTARASGQTVFCPEAPRFGETAKARIALPPAALATASPVTSCARTEKTAKRAQPKTRYGRTRHNKSFDLNEPDASIASTLVEFDPRHTLDPEFYSHHGILHNAGIPRPLRTRWRLIRRYNSEDM